MVVKPEKAGDNPARIFGKHHTRIPETEDDTVFLIIKRIGSIYVARNGINPDKRIMPVAAFLDKRFDR